MNTTLEDRFFALYANENGAAYMSLTALLNKIAAVEAISQGYRGWNHVPESCDKIIAEEYQLMKEYKVAEFLGDSAALPPPLFHHRPIINEIESNLKECRDESEKEKYLTRIILTFGSWVLALYGDSTTSEERAEDVNNLIGSISNNLPEYSLSIRIWESTFRIFVKAFAAMLADNGKDILSLQDKCGVQLICSDEFNAEELLFDFGSWEYANTIFQGLTSTSTTSTTQTKQMQVKPKFVITDTWRNALKPAVKHQLLNEDYTLNKTIIKDNRLAIILAIIIADVAGLDTIGTDKKMQLEPFVCMWGKTSKELSSAKDRLKHSNTMKADENIIYHAYQDYGARKMIQRIRGIA